MSITLAICCALYTAGGAAGIASVYAQRRAAYYRRLAGRNGRIDRHLWQMAMDWELMAAVRLFLAVMLAGISIGIAAGGV